MATFEHEAGFVGSFWLAADSRSDRDQAAAWEAASRIGPEHIQNHELRTLYDILRIRFAEGEPVDPQTVVADALHTANSVSTDVVSAAIEHGISAARVSHFTVVIENDARRRSFLDLTEKAVRSLRNGGGKDGGRALAERFQTRLLELYSESGSGGFKSQAEIVAEGKARALKGEEGGIVLPWPKLQKACGPWVAGEVVGIPGFSGTGKSAFAANLFIGLCARGVPVIAFPTEMREQWLDRVVAAIARVPQWRAEKRQWKGAELDRDRFIGAWDRLLEWEWAVVGRSNITPAEVVTAVRILRRKWVGRTVVVIVDHMHRLDYGDDTADEMAGAATKAFKNLAGDDPDGGLVPVLLYQPRKPSDNTYRPVLGHEIRGHGGAWNELDVILSPFRQWVKTSEWDKRPDGEPKTRTVEGKPVLAKPESDGSRLDDERFYLKPVKRRVGGEGPALWLNFDAESGWIYEEAENA